MSLQSRLTGAGLTLGLLITVSLPALAQQPSTAQGSTADTEQQQTERTGKRWHRGEHGKRGMMRLFRELNLTDAQQQQANAIIERYEASTKPQREEMRQLFQQKQQGTATADAEARAQALHTELRESHKRMRDELLTILTPDQRARLEQIKQEHKARREEWRTRRQGQTDNDDDQ